MQLQSEIEGRHAASAAQRKVIHDLRNLFAIIGAGKSLLERDPPPARHREVLAAIEEATRQGAQLTTDLLASSADRSQPLIVDVGERLAKLAPMMRVLTSAQVNLAQSSRHEPLLVRIVPADFDAVVLELVFNAAAAGASSVTIRSRTCNDRVWTIVSDNGCGMSSATLARARRGNDLGLAHGTGLSRIRQFMDMSGGHLRIRSRPSIGTHIALIFPTVLNTSDDALDATWRPALPLQKEENHGKVGYPVAA